MAAAGPLDPLDLAAALIRCKSVTPVDDGAIAVVQAALAPLGFRCHPLTFTAEGTAPVENLYARLGAEGPNFCFCGHTDVVPVGDSGAWSADPFDPVVRDGRLYGRGAADMKGSIACFIAAVARVQAARKGALPGSVSLLITGDEEGVNINGAVKVLRWMAEQGETIDACLVGEPTNPARLGEMIKVGRRGSVYGRLTVHGTTGHIAYPDLADNPIPRLLRMLSAIDTHVLDQGYANFQPSNLEIVDLEVGNTARNVIPPKASAVFGIRFNPNHSSASLEAWLRRTCDAVGGDYTLEMEVSGEPFYTEPGPLSDLVVAAIRSVTGLTPEFSTSGGTSDARFVRAYCPVVEFGLISQSMHKVNENAALDDLAKLTDVYSEILERWFAALP